MTSALILGCTGLVGSHILSTLQSSTSSHFSSIHIITRRSPPASTSTPTVPLVEFLNTDTTTWASHISSLSPTPPAVLFCALAATRGSAGSFDSVYKIDHDLNLELARAAKDAGTKVYVLISSGAASPRSMMGYLRMKGELEEHVKELGFDHTIILQPGLLVGDRTEFRPAETALRYLAQGLGYIHSSLRDSWTMTPGPIANAAVSAATKALTGQVQQKVWILGQKDIIRLGVTEWEGA